MTQEQSISLGYIGFNGDPEQWKHFAQDIFGLQAVESDEGLLLRTDERDWRIAITPGAKDGLDYIGFEVGSETHLSALKENLENAGFSAEEDTNLARSRRVNRLVKTTAPDGTHLELFTCGLISCTPFSSPTGATFVTGDCGLGHVLLMVPDIQASLEFYRGVLGFRRSDVIEMGEGIDAHFLSGCKRHHVVALACIPEVSGFDHLFIEVDKSTTVGKAWDKVMSGAAPIARSLGQHANDPAFSFYVETPSGVLLEYGSGATVVDDPESWVESRWESPYLWGGTFGSRAVR